MLQKEENSAKKKPPKQEKKKTIELILEIVCLVDSKDIRIDQKMKFDDILLELGEFGPYQKRLYFLVCLPAITCALHGLIPVFIFDIPSYRCAVPSLDNDTYKSQGAWHDNLLNETVPYKDGTWSQCQIYADNKTDMAVNRSTESCHRWVYDKSVFIRTAVSELNLVCDKETYRSHINMITFSGNVFGSLCFGFLSDIIGRRKTLLIALVLHVAAGVGLAFAENFAGVGVLRFLDGTTNSGIFLISFGIGMEFVGPSKRTFAGIFIEYFWCLGLFMLALFAYLLRDWRDLALTVGVPPVLFFLYYWLLPESPRWLVSKERFEEAEVIMKKVAEKNQTSLRKDMFDEKTNDDGPSFSIFLLFKSPRLMINSVILFFNWFVVNVTYNGIFLNVANLSGNIYLNFTVSTIMEVIAYTACLILLEKLGRKIVLCTSLIIGGMACVCTMFTVLYGDNSHTWINIVLSNIGKLGVSSAFAIMFVYTCELFPTVVRTSGLGAATFCGQVGGVLSPYIADLSLFVKGDFSTALPLIVIGGLALAAGLLSIMLPETLHKPLPETIQDAEELAKGISFRKRKNNYEMKGLDIPNHS